MKSVFILMVTYKRLGFLRATIESLRTTMPEGAKIVVVVNDQGADVYEYLRGVAKDDNRINTIYLEQNVGWGAAVNIGLHLQPEWKEYEYTMVVNNDETYDRHWYEVSDILMKKYPKIGLLGLWRHPNHGTVQEFPDMDIRDNAPGVAWLFRSKDLEKFLPFLEHGSTTIVGGNGEDVSMTHKILAAGMWIAAPRNDLAHHIEGYNEDKLGKDNPEYL